MEKDQIKSIANALIVGGGIGGMATAISLAGRGVAVTLIDIDPDWRVYGAGITITGPTLRAYRQLGLLDEIKTKGAITSKTRLFRFDGTHLHDLVEPVIEEGLPATGGIMRPVLHRIMQDRVRALNIAVQLGITVQAIDAGDEDQPAAVTFSDGATGAFDLVVGCDSVYSSLREMAFAHMGPAPLTGQGCWRISMRRPPGLDQGEFYLGHENPCGITACAEDMIYLWMLTRHVPRKEHFSAEELFTTLKALLADFGGNAGWVRDHMTRHDWINYRPLAAALQSRPWFDGRVMLLGDAVHATTPHLASGAGMAVESALALADELARMDTVTAGLQAFEDRRFERCHDIVETSLKIGQMQLDHRPPAEHAALLEGVFMRLNTPF